MPLSRDRDRELKLLLKALNQQLSHQWAKLQDSKGHECGQCSKARPLWLLSRRLQSACKCPAHSLLSLLCNRCRCKAAVVAEEHRILLASQVDSCHRGNLHLRRSSNSQDRPLSSSNLQLNKLQEVVKPDPVLPEVLCVLLRALDKELWERKFLYRPITSK